MIFSDTNNFLGIVQDIDYLLFGSSTATSPYLIADKTRNINNRLDETVSLIMKSDARWKWDDDNQTDQPIGTINLISEQAEYEIAGATYLKILRVEVLDVNGNYKLIKPIDEKQIQHQSLTEFLKTPGMPRLYDKNGEYIWLYPKPSSALTTLTAGLKIYYQRLPSYFTASDTTKSPGFNPLYHKILSIGAAIDFAIPNGLTEKISILTPMLTNMQNELIEFYSNRANDEKTTMTTKRESYNVGYGGEDGYYGVSDIRI